MKFLIKLHRLSVERIDVKMKRKYVDKYKAKNGFTCLSEQSTSELITHVADLVSMKDTDDKAVEFDNLIYGLMLAQLEGKKTSLDLKMQPFQRHLHY
ncbi:hypothetical protein ACFYKX_13160 [Cytobacillus sp. FJAT-54145]|uniref:Uncharacterized protein n=1 Tax=Cytobacillus spartinae TaxID=3299023 RepID=A0ABW6KBI5_9BACI